jgi:nitrate reductase NapE component
MEPSATPPSCPACGSVDLQYVEARNLDSGRAAVGFVIAGPIGAAVGGTTGKRNLDAVCKSCGETFNHYLTRRNLQVAKKYLGLSLDFEDPSHRAFYVAAAEELRRCGRLNVTDPVNLHHQWRIIRRLANDSGVEYDTRFMPAGLSEKDVEKIESRGKHQASEEKLFVVLVLALVPLFAVIALLGIVASLGELAWIAVIPLVILVLGLMIVWFGDTWSTRSRITQLIDNFLA